MTKYVCEIVDDLKRDDSFITNDKIEKVTKLRHTFNMNNKNLGLRMLAKRLITEDIEVHAYSYYLKNNIDPNMLIFQDIPNKNFESIISKWKNTVKYLIINESEIIKSKSWDVSLHNNFDKIFTWHLDYIKHEKFIHLPSINTRFDLNNIFHNISFKNRPKFSSIVASNKFSNHPLELYSERLKTINWFSENHYKNLDLYGFGWNKLKIYRKNIFARLFNRLGFPSKFFVKYTNIYKGMIDNKINTLTQYKFDFVYENAIGIPGYVTEKIFDSFLAGTIPVYLGPEISTLTIPKNCFIDRRNFKNHDDLYYYLVNMSEEEYKEKQENISIFLHSDPGKMFSVESYVDILCNQIIKDLNTND